MPAEDPVLVVVEDDPDDRALIGRALKSLRPGLAMAVVCDGIELLELLARCAPRLVLLDLNLPRLDGREALARVRGTPAAAAMRVVVFTTSTEPGERDRALALGAADFVSKPDSYRALVTVLGGILDRHLGAAA